MKRLSLISMACLMAFGYSAQAQYQDVSVYYADSTGLPGDNFSLQGALEMFKNSKNLEEFERNINSSDNKINNLDLNNDGKTDYIRVVDNFKNESHAIVLQVPVNKTENQDIAVIEIEKQGESQVSIQIVGDEDIYGENVFYEPTNEKDVKTAPAKGGPSANLFAANIWLNVWYWPCVQFIYAPHYAVWVSPWYWDYYPNWWRPWNPYPWRYHYGFNYHHHQRYFRSHSHYGMNAYQAYKPYRRTSVYVVNRHRPSINTYRTGRSNTRRENVATYKQVHRSPADRPAYNSNRKSANYSQPRAKEDVNNTNRRTNNNYNTSKGRYEPKNEGAKTQNRKPANNKGNVRQSKPARSNQPARQTPGRNAKPVPRNNHR